MKCILNISMEHNPPIRETIVFHPLFRWLRSFLHIAEKASFELSRDFAQILDPFEMVARVTFQFGQLSLSRSRFVFGFLGSVAFSREIPFFISLLRTMSDVYIRYNSWELYYNFNTTLRAQ
jgi:hypothetical protein